MIREPKCFDCVHECLGPLPVRSYLVDSRMALGCRGQRQTIAFCQNARRTADVKPGVVVCVSLHGSCCRSRLYDRCRLYSFKLWNVFEIHLTGKL